MTTPTPEAIEAAAIALFDDNPVWHLVHDRPALWSEVVESAKDRYRQQARVALTAAAPFIAAQALRDAADEWFGGPRKWLNDRAATIEGKSE